jgi:hypothetical protein
MLITSQHQIQKELLLLGQCLELSSNLEAQSTMSHTSTLTPPALRLAT